nr:reverse transcriptase domain-containing protein [Tanacetum cinerariifolium]
MVTEGIILGHKISKNGLEVDHSKVDVIAKLPYLTSVKGVMSFLGHVGFYRRFIQEFSKIARPMTHLLKKETPFVFSKDCIDAFETLKKKLTEASILVVPDWNLPFELMCNASDFAIGAQKKKFFKDVKRYFWDDPYLFRIPFTITKVFPYGTVELSQPDGPNFKVNGHRIKHYFGGDVPQLVVPDLQTFPMDE